MSELPPSAPPPPADVTDNDKLMAGLAYFLTPLVPAIVLLSPDMKARPFQKYHSIQALGLLVAELVLSVILCVVYFVCTALSAGILGLCLWVLFFIPVIPQIYYAIIAYTRGQYFEIPTLTQFMVQQGWLIRP
jgi:uncharacterized membrane protein